MWGINKIIRILIASDFFLQAGWGLSGPIFAIFLTQQIGSSLDAEGKIRMVGLIAATYWITKSVVQPFLAKWFDRNHGEKDDFIFLMVGMYVANLIPLGYIYQIKVFLFILSGFIEGFNKLSQNINSNFYVAVIQFFRYSHSIFYSLPGNIGF